MAASDIVGRRCGSQARSSTCRPKNRASAGRGRRRHRALVLETRAAFCELVGDGPALCKRLLSRSLVRVVVHQLEIGGCPVYRPITGPLTFSSAHQRVVFRCSPMEHATSTPATCPSWWGFPGGCACRCRKRLAVGPCDLASTALAWNQEKAPPRSKLEVRVAAKR